MKNTEGKLKKVRRKVVFQRKKQNKTGMVLVSLVVAMLLVVVKIRSIELNEILIGYKEVELELLANLEEAERDKIELEEEQKRVQTKQYAEEVAKDNLGLVYDNEIIFMLE
ncbi:MAG: septum formation initiator family protein [Eubacteriales bacterium]